MVVFDEKMLKNIWWVRKNVVTLHSQFGDNGSIAQLNRASHYGCEGYRFESCWSHLEKELTSVSSFFCVALNFFVVFIATIAIIAAIATIVIMVIVVSIGALKIIFKKRL